MKSPDSAIVNLEAIDIEWVRRGTLDRVNSDTEQFLQVTIYTNHRANDVTARTLLVTLYLTEYATVTHFIDRKGRNYTLTPTELYSEDRQLVFNDDILKTS